MAVNKEFYLEKYKAWVQFIDDSFWLHYQGRTYRVSPSAIKQDEDLKDDSAVMSNELQAPIAGRVIDVLKKQGDLVKKGELIIVIESMKIEYKIKSYFDGSVERLHVNLSDSVKENETLVTLKKN